MGYAPNTDNFTLGRGVVFFDLKDSVTGNYHGERDLGNSPTFEYSCPVTKLDHYSSRSGLKTKDAEIILEMNPAVAFTLDEITQENLALLTLGNQSTVVQTAGTVVAEAHVANQGLRINLEYRSISSVVIKTTATTPVTLVAGVDYLIDTTLNDAQIGRVLILEGSTVIPAGTVDTPVTVAYSYGASTYTIVDGFARTTNEGRLRFVSSNPIGTQLEVQMWRVILTPTGNTAMIGDNWSTLGFTGELLKDPVNHPTTPFMQFVVTEQP